MDILLFVSNNRTMMVLVSYDVSTVDKKGKNRLRKVAKICEDYGQRVQHSVFECQVDPGLWVVFKNRLLKIINKDKDSLRFYYLGKNWRHRVEHIGAKAEVDLEEPLIL